MLDLFESNGNDFSELLEQVSLGLSTFIDGLDHAPVDGRDQAREIVDLIAEHPGEGPGDFGKLTTWALQAAGAAVETASPRFFGYVPGSGLVSSAVGEMMALVLNRFTGISEMAPGLVALEHGVLDWLGSLFEMPPEATGILTTGGSQAMISMIVAAREHHLRHTDLSQARMYLSDQTHHSVAKAAHICGFPGSSIHVVPTAAGGKLDPAALASAIVDDRAAGYIPFLVVGTAGTTNLGLVEPLAKLAGIARDNGLWFHVDGCYGGFFQLTRRGRARLDGIGLADSITVDPHKGLFLPYGTGALLVRDRRLLSASYSAKLGDYMPVPADDDVLPDYARLGTELTREHRGLRVWLPLHLHGLGAFRAALDEKLDLAEHLHSTLAAESRLDVLGPPELSTVVFRLCDGGDDANQALLERIMRAQRVYLSSTRLDGRFTLRVCVLSHRTHREHVEEVVRAIRDALPE